MRFLKVSLIGLFFLGAALGRPTPASGQSLFGPDLKANKRNNVDAKATLGDGWKWIFELSNVGDTDATFTAGQVVFRDMLPDTNIQYGAVEGPDATLLKCAVDNSTLTCTAVTDIAILAGTFFTVELKVFPQVVDTFDNPRPSGTCAIDPDGVISEYDEGDNFCKDSVTVVKWADLTALKSNNVNGSATVGAPFTWTIVIANAASSTAAASFEPNEVVLLDEIPFGATYGPVTVTPASTNISCTQNVLSVSCVALGGGLVIPPGASFSVQFTATPIQIGDFANPRSPGVCAVDPNKVEAELIETNNDCSDTVSSKSLDLTAVKTNNATATTRVGDPFKWTIRVAASGTGSAVFTTGRTILTDSLPATGLTYGGVAVTAPVSVTGAENISCTINASQVLGCAATGTVSIGSGGRFDVELTLTSTDSGVYVNPRTGGTCGVDPNNSVGETNEANNACADTVTVQKRATTVSLSTSLTPSRRGDPVTFTATVSGTAASTPTGSVQFVVDGTVILGTVNLSAGKATLTSSTLTAGTHTVTANYGGDALYGPSVGTLTQVIMQVYSLAEGATLAPFDTYLLIANPNLSNARIDITFLPETGIPVTLSQTVNANRRFTLQVDTVPGLGSASFATTVVSKDGLPLIVEESMYWGDGYTSGNTFLASEQTSKTWFFAEGSENTLPSAAGTSSIDTYLLLQNDNDAATNVTVEFLLPNGPLTRGFTVNARSRRTVITGAIPELVGQSFGMTVSSDLPINAARAEYFGPGYVGGHGSTGVPAASTTWYYAEGSTKAPFDTYIAMANPGGAPANVAVTIRLTTGQTITRNRVIASKSRQTLYINEQDSALVAGADFWVAVTSDQPIVADRITYFPAPVASWLEAHSSTGVTQGALRSGLAEGVVGKSLNFLTYILLANPSATNADVTLNFVLEDGTVVGRSLTVPAFGRASFDTSTIAALANQSFAIIMTSNNAVPVVMEESLYWRNFRGGSASPAAPLP